MTDPLRESLQRSLGTAYTIERELGGGGMSRVFLAREVRFAREVVVKVLSPALASELHSERFEREIALAARLQEPHIVPVLTAGETADGLSYYTMPFVAGESLRARLKHGRVEAGEAVSILRDVARALAYAHERGVVHRDIKPENVLLSSGTAVVTDFGIAKAIRASLNAGTDHVSEATLTRTGMSVGTPAYMAPEQVGGDSVDGRADVYAWGVLGYEMLAGAHPFANRATSQQLIVAHLGEQPRPIAEQLPGVPPQVATLVMRALAKQPTERPTAAELLTALDEAPGSGMARARRARAWLGGGALLALAITGALAVRGRLRLPPERSATNVETSGRSTGAAVTSVAVLPFVNAGGDLNDDYFSDGLSDELAHALVRLPGLRVAGHASSNAFRNRVATAPEIGRALGVAAIIEGTVRRAGRRLRVTAELTSTRDGHVIWTSEPFESQSADVFEVQDQFTRAVVAALEPTLRGESATTLATASRGTSDAEAYDLYLHGRYFWSRRGVANLNRAIDYFQRAAARDPRFARAHAGLAMAYVVLPFFDASVSSDSTAELARASAERALAIDPSIADAHLALANYEGRSYHLADAGRHHLAVLAAAPLDPTAHAWYGDYLERRGLRDSAIAEKRRAVELEPLSALITNQLAQELYIAQRVPEALALAHRVNELDSTFTRGYFTLARIQLFRGFSDSALIALRTATRFGPLFRGARGVQVLAYAADGRWGEARSLRDSIEREQATRPSNEDLALASLAFGARAAAIDALQRSVALHELQLLTGSPGCDPLLEPLHAEPRFLALMRRIETHVCPAAARWPVRAGQR